MGILSIFGVKPASQPTTQQGSNKENPSSGVYTAPNTTEELVERCAQIKILQDEVEVLRADRAEAQKKIEKIDTERAESKAIMAAAVARRLARKANANPPAGSIKP